MAVLLRYDYKEGISTPLTLDREAKATVELKRRSPMADGRQHKTCLIR